MTVVTLADYARCPHPRQITPTPTTGLSPVGIVRATYESVLATEGQAAALYAMQEMVATGCVIIERDGSRDLMLETLVTCAASTR